jgi:hypothetical protein
MCEIVIDRRFDLIRIHAKAYKDTVAIWRLNIAAAAMKLYDVQDGLEQGVKYWDRLCHYYDELREHDLQCERDHTIRFADFKGFVTSFLYTGTEFLNAHLPRFEAEYGPGNVEYSCEFRQALKEARSLFGPFDEDLDEARTHLKV